MTPPHHSDPGQQNAALNQPAMVEPNRPAHSYACGRRFWGLLLVALGSLLLLDQMHLLDFGELLSRFWPLVFIFIGARMILSRSPRRAQETTVVSPAETVRESGPGAPLVADVLSENRFIGDFNMRVQSEDFRGGSVSTFIGDFNIDLSNVGIKSGDRYLTLSGFIGDVTLALPKTLPYVIQASAFIGDFKVFGRKDEGLGLNKIYKSPDFESAAARLHVRISYFIGDLTVL